MALYISASHRARRTIVIAAAAALVAFALGWLIGRQQIPSIDNRVAEVQRAAEDAATGLERLDIEYQQVLDATDTLETSVLVPIDDLRVDLQRTMDRAPWLSAEQRAQVLDSLAGVRQAALDGVPLTDFDAAISEAATTVRSTFGV